ncbi:hypothetical protein CL6EHI_068690 [Entamoeba histolytica]|uniref:Ubiquitin-like-conjugating enzyme ATG10 n=3 Tax=Entamoeba histolytica TaxID=5759 RepID=C4LU59_ENTH1|nr:hypothetical protein EHI_068690 [Entamoeba histolytica HM-1:IMSS]EAL45119.1 hypothetical protein EHI_068690 [Entamoeba histolytica HM-1:IMSS]ENY60295.1 autophagocytosis associated protein, c-terminal domain containing protein [Entamoeba histolytica HM-1:IMSS-A]GAT92130.1 hypothetical protein CL6EHI_068690 [Entamoeba histolytica]|eukprot:XP_650505.1 hypothetical protein EHI_068690 [Entamoeba histolytica HM-1:IMSS]
MNFNKKEFNFQAKKIVNCLNKLGKYQWKWDTRGFIIHSCELGELLQVDDNHCNEEIYEEKDDTICQIQQKRYYFIHHILYNTSYQVPQFGVSLFDKKENKYITQLEQATTLLSHLSGIEKCDNNNPLNLFITMNEHPLIEDYYMFFIHPCGTSSSLLPIIEFSLSDYLICYLSSYGPYLCCFENWLSVQHKLITENQN